MHFEHITEGEEKRVKELELTYQVVENMAEIEKAQRPRQVLPKLMLTAANRTRVRSSEGRYSTTMYYLSVLEIGHK